MKKTTIILVTLLSLIAPLALAKDHDNKDHDRCHAEGRRHCMSAPEIDPAQALGALSLLGGTIAIIRGYRRRKK
jgi:hypothetical protein